MIDSLREVLTSDEPVVLALCEPCASLVVPVNMLQDRCPKCNSRIAGAAMFKRCAPNEGTAQ